MASESATYGVTVLKVSVTLTPGGVGSQTDPGKVPTPATSEKVESLDKHKLGSESTAYTL